MQINALKIISSAQRVVVEITKSNFSAITPTDMESKTDFDSVTESIKRESPIRNNAIQFLPDFPILSQCFAMNG